MNISLKCKGRLVKLARVLLLVFSAGCAATNQEVAGTGRAPISPDAVKVYPVAPVDSKTVGTVSVVSFYGITVQQLHDDVLNKLKTEAAGMGANGVVIESSDEAPLSGAKATATAIFVSR